MGDDAGVEKDDKHPLRTLEFDDDWGENKGVVSAFGEYTDDGDVMRKHQKEEDEAEERRLEEEVIAFRAVEREEKEVQEAAVLDDAGVAVEERLLDFDDQL